MDMMGKHEYKVISVGETCLDIFLTLGEESHYCHLNEEGELCLRHGEKIGIEKDDICLGGNATNVAVGLSRLGVRTTLCSEIGDDEFSLKIRNALAREGVDRLFVVQSPGPSNFSVIINYLRDRTIFVKHVERKHNFHLTEVKTDYVYLTSLAREWQEPYRRILDFVKKKKCKLVFNPGTRQMDEGKETLLRVLRHTDILFVNKEEACHLVYNNTCPHSSNEHDYVRELMTKLKKMGPKMVVVTNGRHGSFAMDEKDETYYETLLESEIVERTGTGDSFTSGFLAAIVHGLPVKEAMKWGTANASSVVSHIGAQTGLLKKEEMEELLKNF